MKSGSKRPTFSRAPSARAFVRRAPSARAFGPGLWPPLAITYATSGTRPLPLPGGRTQALARRNAVLPLRVGVVLRALYDDHRRVLRSHDHVRVSFLAAVMPCRAGDGGRPMADAHEEKALLGPCNAYCLRLSTPSRARSAPCTRAAFQHIP